MNGYTSENIFSITDFSSYILLLYSVFQLNDINEIYCQWLIKLTVEKKSYCIVVVPVICWATTITKKGINTQGPNDVSSDS